MCNTRTHSERERACLWRSVAVTRLQSIIPTMEASPRLPPEPGAPQAVRFSRLDALADVVYTRLCPYIARVISARVVGCAKLLLLLPCRRPLTSAKSRSKKMGRLGFNLAGPKETSKNVEEGEPDHQQNEKNENVEICELLLTIEQRNRTIRTLRLMLTSLACVLVLACGFIAFVQTKVEPIDQAPPAALNSNSNNKFDIYTEDFESLQNQYEALVDAMKLERTSNCTHDENDTILKLRGQVLSQRADHEKEMADANQRYESLRMGFENLQREIEVISRHCARKEADLMQKLQNSELERGELATKIMEVNNKLKLSTEQKQVAIKTTTTTTTTPAPSRSLFDPERFKKINDLVKDIETGEAIYDMNQFLKKTEEAFRL